MKNFIIGLVIGFLIGGTSAYGVIMSKVKDVATKDNLEKVEDASKTFVESVKDIF